MEPANNFIDDLVRKSFPDKVTSAEDTALWDSIDKTLRFKGFLRFSLSHFNIYYSVLIVLVISSASYLIINNASAKNTPPVNNNSFQTVPAVKDNIQMDSKDNKAIESSVAASQNVNLPTADKSGGQNIQKQVSGTTDANPANVNNNSEKPLIPAEDNNSKKTKKVKVIKKQVVITDTVHKKDTVYIKKTSPTK